MMRKPIHSDAFTRRLRLSSREIAVATALTLAALAFLAAAVTSTHPDRIGRAPGEPTNTSKAN